MLALTRIHTRKHIDYITYNVVLIVTAIHVLDVLIHLCNPVALMWFEHGWININRSQKLINSVLIFSIISSIISTTYTFFISHHC